MGERKMHHLFRLFAAILFCATLLSGPLRAEEAPSPSDTANVQAVISAQMDAFKRDDGAAAFAFAAPAIKKMFGTPENFMEMVRSQYAPVFRPGYVEYLEPLAVGDQFMQPFILTGENGVTVLARYALRRQASGDWRIIGVTLSPAPDQAPL
tara:strand:+ start:176 stop:631 length:456 start_codon:yes stop_codon:yes gene_type:complete